MNGDQHRVCIDPETVWSCRYVFAGSDIAQPHLRSDEGQENLVGQCPRWYDGTAIFCRWFFGFYLGSFIHIAG